jgi:hypothetical protein
VCECVYYRKRDAYTLMYMHVGCSAGRRYARMRMCIDAVIVGSRRVVSVISKSSHGHVDGAIVCPWAVA